jgi:hypothetical protein
MIKENVDMWYELLQKNKHLYKKIVEGWTSADKFVSQYVKRWEK